MRTILPYALIALAWLHAGCCHAASAKYKAPTHAAISRAIPELFTYEIHGRQMTVTEDHWLWQWLQESLKGKLTGFPIVLQRQQEAVGGHQFKGMSCAYPVAGRMIGHITLLDPTSERLPLNSRFANAWFRYLFEISNLIATPDFIRVESLALKKQITEDEFVLREMEIEFASVEKAIHLYEVLLGQLWPPEEKRFPTERASFSAYRGRKASPALLKHPVYAPHVRHYRSIYRKWTGKAPPAPQ